MTKSLKIQNYLCIGHAEAAADTVEEVKSMLAALGIQPDRQSQLNGPQQHANGSGSTATSVPAPTKAAPAPAKAAPAAQRGTRAAPVKAAPPPQEAPEEEAEPEGEAAASPVDPSKLQGVTKLREVVSYLEQCGYSSIEDIVAVCEEIRNEVPLLKRVSDIPSRVKAAYDLLQEAKNAQAEAPM